MAGVSLEGAGKGRRKSLDSDINMIPMIDLLMVTISFLLITAVWTHLARLDATAQVPGPSTAEPCDGLCEPPRTLHIDMRAPQRFTLSWRQGNQVVQSWDITRTPTAGRTQAQALRFPELAAATRHARDIAPPGEGTVKAVLHTSNSAKYEEMIAAMDAIAEVRSGPKSAPAFAVSLATD